MTKFIIKSNDGKLIQEFESQFGAIHMSATEQSNGNFISHVCAYDENGVHVHINKEPEEIGIDEQSALWIGKTCYDFGIKVLWSKEGVKV